MKAQNVLIQALLLIVASMMSIQLNGQEIDGRIKNVMDPVNPQDAATKAYVDALELLQGIKDIDNNRYGIVTIQNQTWMAENLRVTRYNDGTPIPLVTVDTAWADSSAASAPAYTWYDNTSSPYGALYNWYVVDTLSNGNKNVCPVGWHVPSQAEWMVLTDFFGESSAGGALKETGLAHWEAPNGGATNAFGFTGLPGGYRTDTGSFIAIYQNASWWSTSESTAIAGLYLEVTRFNDNATYDNSPKGHGNSVRCLKN